MVIDIEYDGDRAPFPAGTLEHLRQYCAAGLAGMVTGVAGFYQVSDNDLRAAVTAATVRALPEGGQGQ